MSPSTAIFSQISLNFTDEYLGTLDFYVKKYTLNFKNVSKRSDTDFRYVSTVFISVAQSLIQRYQIDSH